jgi:hypothetical protein
MESVSIGGTRMARTCVAVVAAAAALMSLARPALGARPATPREQHSILAAAVRAVDASSGDLDYAAVNRYRGVEYGLLLAGTGNEHGLTILKKSALAGCPELTARTW